MDRTLASISLSLGGISPERIRWTIKLSSGLPSTMARTGLSSFKHGRFGSKIETPFLEAPPMANGTVQQHQGDDVELGDLRHFTRF